MHNSALFRRKDDDIGFNLFMRYLLSDIEISYVEVRFLDII
jgi:hypothetical protein